MVVVVSPAREDLAGIGERVKHFFIQALVAQLAIEALDEAVLLRFARRDIVPSDAGLILPFEDGATGQFSPVVRDNGFWPAIKTDAAIQFAGYAGTRQGCICDQRQAFSSVVVDHAEHAEPPGRSEDIGHEVEAPTLRWAVWHRHRFTRASRALAASPAFYRQSFLFVETPQFLVVHHDALPFEHNANAPIAEPTARCCDLAHAFADLRIVRFRLTPDGFRIDADQSAGAALGDVVFVDHLERRVPLQLGRRQFFPSRSFRIELSSMLSASSFFSRAFSVSSVFSLRASDTSIPPYFAFHL